MSFQNPMLGDNSGLNQMQLLQARAAAGNQGAAGTLAARDPSQVQAAFQGLQGMNNTQAAQYMQNNPAMRVAMQNAGMINSGDINNLFAGNGVAGQQGWQTSSGQAGNASWQGGAPGGNPLTGNPSQGGGQQPPFGSPGGFGPPPPAASPMSGVGTAMQQMMGGQASPGSYDVGFRPNTAGQPGDQSSYNGWSPVQPINGSNYNGMGTNITSGMGGVPSFFSAPGSQSGQVGMLQGANPQSMAHMQLGIPLQLGSSQGGSFGGSTGGPNVFNASQYSNQSNPGAGVASPSLGYMQSMQGARQVQPLGQGPIANPIQGQQTPNAVPQGGANMAVRQLNQRAF